MASKLITLPANDPDQARKTLRKWLAFDDKVLIIVLGDTNIAFETADSADRLTGGFEDEPRWVIHGPNRDDIVDVLDELEDPDEITPDWNTVLFIAVSITDKIRDVVIRDGNQPNFSRIEDAFIAAESD